MRSALLAVRLRGDAGGVILRSRRGRFGVGALKITDLFT